MLAYDFIKALQAVYNPVNPYSRLVRRTLLNAVINSYVPYAVKMGYSANRAYKELKPWLSQYIEQPKGIRRSDFLAKYKQYKTYGDKAYRWLNRPDRRSRRVPYGRVSRHPLAYNRRYLYPVEVEYEDGITGELAKRKLSIWSNRRLTDKQVRDTVMDMFNELPSAKSGKIVKVETLPYIRNKYYVKE